MDKANERIAERRDLLPLLFTGAYPSEADADAPMHMQFAIGKFTECQ